MPELKMVKNFIYLKGLNATQKHELKKILIGSRFFQREQGFQIPEIYIKKAIQKGKNLPFGVSIPNNIRDYMDMSKKLWNPKFKFSKHIRNRKWIWQARLIRKALPFGSYCFFCEPGTGKTIIALETIKQIMLNRGKHCKFIIVAPSEIINTAFIPDLKRFYPYFKWQAINATDRSEKLNQIRANVNVYLITPESYGIDIYNTELHKRHSFTGIFIDESGKYMREGNKLTKWAIKRRFEYKHRFVLSGLPAPNTPLEYFWQCAFVEQRLTGFDFEAWRKYYFHPNDENFYIWDISKPKLRELLNDLKPRASWVKILDVMKLPPQKHIKKVYMLDDKQKKIYERMRKNLALKLKNVRVISNTNLGKILLLRELTSGFIYRRKNHKVEAINIGSQKLRILRDEILPKIGRKKFIVFCHFTHEVERLKRLFDTLGIKYATAYSSTVDKTKEIQRFMYDKNVQALIANAESSSHGIRLQFCNIAIYFSLSYSSDELVQSRHRIWRAGQKKTCYFFYLLAKDTIDEIMLAALNKKLSRVEFAKRVLS